MPPTAAAKKPAFEMPRPPAVVVWRNTPGGESNFAIVTKYGRSAISVLIFPSESRVGVPKDGVRFHADPALKGQAFADSGIWEFTEESLLLRTLVSQAENLVGAKPSK
jgi:hypothetical protein